MNSDSSIVHECHGDAKCSVHMLNGRRALPCSGGAPMYEIPHQEFGQTLERLVLGFEAHLITSALKRANGIIRVAAPMLGVKRQGLDYMLANRHKALKPLVNPQPVGRGRWEKKVDTP